MLNGVDRFAADGSVEFAGSTGLGNLLGERELLGRFVLDFGRGDALDGERRDDGESEHGQYRDDTGYGRESPHRGGMGMALWSERGGTGAILHSKAW